LNTSNGVESPQKRQLPALWCDFQKKHTLFEGDLNDLSVWLDNSLFQKLEGIVITGSETGSAVNEEDLRLARKSILKTQEKINQLAGDTINTAIPLVTGSGSNIEMYSKYVDYIIVGTALKKNNYWENDVDESLVIELLKRFEN
jgi:predicted TIM-barrel enzyme